MGWLPSQPMRKSAWNMQSSYGLYWQSYGWRHNRYENQPGIFKAVMDYFGKSPGHRQNWHNQLPYRLFWKSYGWRHNRYENKLATDSEMYRNSIGGANIV